MQPSGAVERFGYGRSSADVRLQSEFIMGNLKVGDRVVRNPATWQPNEFDSWGRGIGIGVVVEPPFVLDSDEVDVRWPGGQCFES